MIYRFKIGPVRIHIEADSVPHDAQDAWSYYWSFADTSTETPSIFLRLRRDAPPTIANAPLLGEVEGHWRLYEEPSAYRLEVIDPVGLGPKQMAFFSKDWARADVYQRPLLYAAPERLASGWVVCDVMEPLVQWWLSLWMAHQEIGLVVHAAGIALEEIGLAFVGESDAGKSTIAGFALDQGHVVLNDERIVLWREKGMWRVSGTPWHGELSQASSQVFPLRQVLFLQKGLRERIHTLATPQGMALILPQVFLPLWNRRMTESVVSLLEQLMKDVSWGALEFRKHPGVIGFLRAQLVNPVLS